MLRNFIIDKIVEIAISFSTISNSIILINIKLITILIALAAISSIILLIKKIISIKIKTLRFKRLKKYKDLNKREYIY